MQSNSALCTSPILTLSLSFGIHLLSIRNQACKGRVHLSIPNQSCKGRVHLSLRSPLCRSPAHVPVETSLCQPQPLVQNPSLAGRLGNRSEASSPLHPALWSPVAQTRRSITNGRMGVREVNGSRPAGFL